MINFCYCFLVSIIIISQVHVCFIVSILNWKTEKQVANINVAVCGEVSKNIVRSEQRVIERTLYVAQYFTFFWRHTKV